MDLKNNKNIIIWAVDPTHEPDRALNIIKELKVLAKHLNCEVQPVTIISKATLNLPIDMNFPWKDRIQVIAQKSVTRYIKKTGAKGFLPPELVFASALSNRKMAIELANYAESKKAQLICANTHAKKTLNPFRMGGFAETLAATSRVPVLLLNDKSLASTQIPTILFATDFSRDSKIALTELQTLAKTFKSKILIYNQVEMPDIYQSDFTNVGRTQVLNMESITTDLEKSRLKKGMALSELLRKEKIDHKLLIQRQQKYLSDDILDVAKKNKVSLIAVATRSGPIAQALLGSVARDILLQAKCPVLVFYRPKASRKSSAVLKQKRRPIAPQKVLPMNEVAEARYA